MPASIANTHLTSAVSAGATKLLLKSITGLVVGWGIFIDKEYYVCNGITGTIASVRPGGWGTLSTAHAAGSRVFYAPPEYFSQYDREGTGVYANEVAQPYINVHTGVVWSVVGGRWVPGNTYGGTTNYGFSPTIWADLPIEKCKSDPSYGSFAMDDFVHGSVVTTALGYVFAGANGLFTQVAAVPHGVRRIAVAGTADNDEAYVTTGNNIAGLVKADASSTWAFEARLKANQITTAHGIFVGLAEETGAAAVDCIADDTMVLKVMDSLGFNILTATDIAGSWRTVQQLTSGALAVVAAAEGGLLATTYTKLGMKSVAGLVTFYVDGVPLATQTLSSSSNFPLDQIMQPSFWVKAGTAAANSIDLDWWAVYQSRIAN